MILCSGCFDGLHAGHVRYLQAARSLGSDPVWVVVAPDTYIRDAKGRNPLRSAGDRAETVGAVVGPGRVLLDLDHTPARTIRSLRPRLFVKGLEWAGKLPMDVVDACHAVGCLMVFVDTPGTHTSETL